MIPSVLITGGAGAVGVALAERLLHQGSQVAILDLNPHHPRAACLGQRIQRIPGDLGNWASVCEAVKASRPASIIHLGGMLSAASEHDPWASIPANVQATWSIIEAARLFDVPQVVFSSSVGTFGSGATGEVIDDQTPQRPTLIYGAAKLFGEHLGRWSRGRFRLDFRAIRYPQVVAPGIRSGWHWAPPMLDDVLLGRPHTADSSEAISQLMTVDDAARATHELALAPASAIRTVCYNVCGCPAPISAGEMAEALRRHRADAQITFRQPGTPPPRRRYDDAAARAEWGWQAEHRDTEAVIAWHQRALRTAP